MRSVFHLQMLLHGDDPHDVEDNMTFLLRHPEDCLRIVEAVGTLKGLKISMQEAEMLWDHYSASMCAGWVCLPAHDQTIVGCIQSSRE